MPSKSLLDQHHSAIKQHVLDPEGSQLPEELRPQLNRVIQIARLLDDYPSTSQIINLMQHKYPVTKAQILRDITIAKDLYKTQHEFDWDFWFAWMIKDQAELIRRCKEAGDYKQWNNAKKVLFSMIGEKPTATEDPKRMEKNVFYIQMNYDGRVINVPREALLKLNQEDMKLLADSCFEEIDQVQAEDLMNS